MIKTYYKDISEVPKGYDKTTPVEGASTNAWFGYRFAGIDPRTVIHWRLSITMTGRNRSVFSVKMVDGF